MIQFNEIKTGDYLIADNDGDKNPVPRCLHKPVFRYRSGWLLRLAFYRRRYPQLNNRLF